MTDVARGFALDRLDRLSTDDLLAVVSVVEQAELLGDAWLQRQEDGTLRARDTRDVRIEELSGPPALGPPSPPG